MLRIISMVVVVFLGNRIFSIEFIVGIIKIPVILNFTSIIQNGLTERALRKIIQI